MPKKGTPQYEIWLEKFSQKKPVQQVESFESQNVVLRLKNKLSSSLIAENDLLMFMFLSHVEADTLSISALQPIRDRFNLEDSSYTFLVSLFKTLSKDILKLRLIGIYNFFNFNEKPTSYPLAFHSKYSSDNFREKYGYDLASIMKTYTL